jgi:hypothetical protein
MQTGRAISRFVAIAAACAISMLAFQAAHVFAGRNTSNFGGDYKVIKVSEQGENVEVKLSMVVINNSGADVKDASILLRSTLHPMPEPSLAWEKQETPIKIAVLHFNEHKIVPPIVATFTIPKAEFERWTQRGTGAASFTIDYVDASGEQRHERLDLAPLT